MKANHNELSFSDDIELTVSKIVKPKNESPEIEFVYLRKVLELIKAIYK